MEALKNEIEAAEYLCLSRSFMRQRRCRGGGPCYVKLGRAIRYSLADLNAWLAENTRRNTVQTNHIKEQAVALKKSK